MPKEAASSANTLKVPAPTNPTDRKQSTLQPDQLALKEVYEKKLTDRRDLSSTMHKHAWYEGTQEI